MNPQIFYSLQVPASEIHQDQFSGFFSVSQVQSQPYKNAQESAVNTTTLREINNKRPLPFLEFSIKKFLTGSQLVKEAFVKTCNTDTLGESWTW